MPRVKSEAEQLCRLAYARYSEGDFDGLLALFDPAVEVYVAPPNFESGTYRGHDEYRRLIERWATQEDVMAHGAGDTFNQLTESVKDDLTEPIGVRMLTAIPAGDPAKGAL